MWVLTCSHLLLLLVTDALDGQALQLERSARPAHKRGVRDLSAGAAGGAKGTSTAPQQEVLILHQQRSLVKRQAGFKLLHARQGGCAVALQS